MKKFVYMLLLALFLLVTPGCANINTRTFRGEVLAFDPMFSYRNDEALLFVYSLTPVMGHPIGGRYFINQNESVVIRDMDGETISHTDIPVGAIVEIRYTMLVLLSYPAIIPGATEIYIVGYN